MHIFLYGPSGSGKSTAGRLLADALDLAFLDLDVEIERSINQPVSTFMIEKGEDAFRQMETSKLRQCVVGPEKVIALGGGTLLSEVNQRLVQSCGRIIFLETDLAILVDRLAQDTNQRPLLRGDLSRSLGLLLRKRAAHYASFPQRVDASPSLEQVVWDIQRLLGRFRSRGMGQAHDVLALPGGLDQLGALLQTRGYGARVMLVSDAHVSPLYAGRAQASLRAAGFCASVFDIPAGETYKNIETVMALWRAYLDAGLDRGSTVIALGGGVVSDLVGFSAATFMRGCRWIAVPTTLLAMVDAGLGGKTGFDLPQGKNLVGAFYPPGLVLADPEVLSSLPERELRAGMAEVVKHGVIADPDLFSLCADGWDAVAARLPEVVRRGMAVKMRLIEQDPYEQGLRAALNFGHTVGHALELVSDFNLLHGEAVAVGMAVEAKLAERLSIAENSLSDLIIKSLAGLSLSVEIPDDLSRNELVQAMKLDKKKTDGTVRFTLPERIGQVKVGVSVDRLEDVFEEEK
jgi:shikimate kinase/3-dehydroquinate synthase